MTSDEQRRPLGSNADEWHLFLTEHLDNRCGNDGLTYMAVQIAKAIDAALAPQTELIEAAKDIVEMVATRDVRSFIWGSDRVEALRAAIAKAEETER